MFLGFFKKDDDKNKENKVLFTYTKIVENNT